MQCFVPQYAANSRSKPSTSSPRTKAAFSQTRSSAGRISSRSPAYSAFRSSKGTFISRRRRWRGKTLLYDSGIYKCCAWSSSDVRERAGDFRAAQCPAEQSKRERKQDCGKDQQRCNGGPYFAPSCAGEERRAHALQRVRDGNHPREQLERARKHRDRIHHAAHESRDAEDHPFRRISAFEENLVAGRHDSESGERQDRGKQDSHCPQPIGGLRRESKQQHAPREIYAGSQRERSEGVKG